MKEIERKSNFIHSFKATEGIHCSSFYVLSAMLGCKFSCSYCFLNLSLRYQKDDLPIFYTNMDAMVEEVKNWLEKMERPSVLNAGELMDSLAFEDKIHLLDKLVPLFASQNRHKLLLLTKTADCYIDFLNSTNPTAQVILSWSVNCNTVWQDYEKGTPNPFERLSAVYSYMKRGWSCRIRIDPIIPVENWTEEYGKVIDVINLLPKNPRVTLGTIRAYPTLPQLCPPSGVFKSCINNNDPDARLRLPEPVRKSIYQWFNRRLKVQPALCKETDKMVQDTRMFSSCNCML